MQSEGGHKNVQTDRIRLDFPILYITNHGLYGKKWYLNFEHSDSIVQIHKRVIPMAWCNWGTRWDVVSLTQGCLVGLKVSSKSVAKQASAGGKAKGQSRSEYLT